MVAVGDVLWPVLPGLLVFLGYLPNLLAGAEGPSAVLAATAAAAWLLLFARALWRTPGNAG